MARWVRQIWLLVWKNFILQIRRPIGTAVEILLPVAFAAILIAAKYGLYNEKKSYCFSTFKEKSTNDLTIYDRSKKLAFFPNNTWTNEIMQNASKRLKMTAVSHDSSGNPFISEDSTAKEAAAKLKVYFAAIIFENAGSAVMPKEVRYKIRMSSEEYGYYDPWNTRRVYPRFKTDGPRGDYGPSYMYQFMPIQRSIDETIIEMQTGQSKWTIPTYLNKFPYPNYDVDTFINTVQFLMPMLFTLAFIYTAVTMIKELVAEKQSQLKESMKMMGLANWVHWLSWFIKNFIFVGLSCVFLTILLKAANILQFSHWSLVFVFFLIYSVSMIFFAFAVSVFFTNPTLSMLFGAVVWLGTAAPYLALASPSSTTYETLTFTQKAALCLLPNTCLGIGVQVITKMEAAQIGAQWDAVNKPPSIDDDFSLALVFLMMLVQSFMWWIITWYVEAVFPGQYGVPKPFYFFLTPSYWCGISCGKNCKENEVYVQATDGTPLKPTKIDPNVEKADAGLEVGVHIDNLSKVFSSSTGKKVAVDGLSLKMYNGQITALLGHNGAGKTTTMSMLTGLYQPTDGRATVGGRSILTDMDQIRDSLGLCPQHNVLFDRLTVKEHLELFIALKGKKGKEAKLKIDQMLEDIQLADKKNAKSVTLSGGMKRKLSCAIALIGDPDVVFLDEPTSGMDPYARRATWDLLQKYTTNKTVVLTTHFMDEADYLGDRIAIMANGSLRCCGSSLFLKKRYGVGYHLNLVKASNFQEVESQKVIESRIPKAKMVSNIGAEMRYVLEHESSKQFKSLFELLEEKKEYLGIGSFGVSITTLEEVFLKVGEESNESIKNGDETDSDDERDCKISKIVDKNELLTGVALKMSQFRAMFVKRFLNSKRQKRAIVTQIILPALMILGGLLLLTLTSAQVDEPPLVLDFSMLSKPGSTTNAYMADYRNNVNQKTKNIFTDFTRKYYSKVRVSLPDWQIITSDTLSIKRDNSNNSVTVDGRKYMLTPTDKTPCCKYKRLVLNEKCKTEIRDGSSFKSLCGNNDKTFGYANCQSCIRGDSYSYYQCPVSVTKTDLTDPLTFYDEYVLRKSNSKFFFRKYVTGITLKNDTRSGRIAITAWYSSEALHNIPSTFSAASNIILAYIKNDTSYGIRITNHPLPRTTKQKIEDVSSSASNLVLCVFVSMAASFIAASFVPYLITEKSTKAKHVQFVSGVDSRVYWIASFCWDYINYLFPAVCIIALFAGFQIDAYKGNDMGVLCLIIFLYGLAVLPFCYCLSFIFKSALIAYAVIALLGMLISMGAVFIVYFFRLSGTESEYYSTGTIIHYIFLLLPIYTLPSSIMDMGNYNMLKKSCKDKKYQSSLCNSLPSSSIGLEYPGVGASCIYMVLECFFYLILAILIEERFFVKCRSNAIISRTPDEEEDYDVAQERHRVNGMMPQDIQNEAVVVQNLSKIFRSNNLKAVDCLSVGIPKRECFGLLGVNGAGKTTTFGMLTGELGITAGTAYLNGFNIQNELREVQQRIGYCPQFDALLDKLTGREMLEMFARLRGIPSYKIPDVVNSVIYHLNLGEWADKMCGNYSGGNKRKLSTAMALVGDPPIIFLDEPTSGMDPASRRFLWNTLSSLLDDERSIILTSHSMEECEALCTRLVIMVNGQFKCLGSIQHLKSRFGQGYTLMIKIGKPEMERQRSSVRRAGSSRNRNNSTSTTSSVKDLVTPEVNVIVPDQTDSFYNDVIEMPAMTAKVKEFIERYMPGAFLLDDRLGMLHYQILNPSLSWSFMFGLLEEHAAQLDIIDYSLSQTTLEQVFINFAKHQRGEIQKKKRCCCCCCG